MSKIDSRLRGNDGLEDVGDCCNVLWIMDEEGRYGWLQPAVYIMSSVERGTLYVGVTGSLKFRVWQHREGLGDGFTKRYNVNHLVWFEHHPDFLSAIAREKQIKKWNRAWKLRLIETANPTWLDLWENLLD